MTILNTIIQAKAKDIGDNFVVRRSLPDINQRMVGPFIFWDHMGPVDITSHNPMKVRAHPHIGLSTLTYLFSGEIMHRDSLGNIQPIVPGEVNWMTAGKGIVHSERAGFDGKNQRLEGIQIWIALPKESEEVEPNFFHIKENELPTIESDNYVIKIVAGEFENKKSPVPVYSPLFYTKVTFKNENIFEHNLNSSSESAVYILNGNINIEGASYEAGSMLCFKKGSSVKFSVTKDTSFMYFGGEVFPEKRHIWWNFVASDKELIESAKDKWKNGEYEAVVDEDEIIPLPEN